MQTAMDLYHILSESDTHLRNPVALETQLLADEGMDDEVGKSMLQLLQVRLFLGLPFLASLCLALPCLALPCVAIHFLSQLLIAFDLLLLIRPSTLPSPSQPAYEDCFQCF